MRIDDPQVLHAIERLEDACATLRRLAGFPPLHPGPEVAASRKPYWCPVDGCYFGSDSAADLEHHLQEHACWRSPKTPPTAGVCVRKEVG